MRNWWILHVVASFWHAPDLSHLHSLWCHLWVPRRCNWSISELQVEKSLSPCQPWRASSRWCYGKATPKILDDLGLKGCYMGPWISDTPKTTSWIRKITIHWIWDFLSVPNALHGASTSPFTKGRLKSTQLLSLQQGTPPRFLGGVPREDLLQNPATFSLEILRMEFYEFLLRRSSLYNFAKHVMG